MGVDLGAGFMRLVAGLGAWFSGSGFDCGLVLGS